MQRPEAILFDFYNTLGVGHEDDGAAELAVLAACGYRVEAAALLAARDALQRRLDGREVVDHRRHSHSRVHYNEFQRTLFASALRDLGIDPLPPDCFERLCDVWDDPSRLRLFDDALPALTRLRAAGFRLGIVSNWSWELQAVLDRTGVAPLVECVVISAQAGYRKPHPAIYTHALDAVALRAEAVWFVGDTPDCDVEGPLAAGMTPVHIDRFDTHPPWPGVHRVRDLLELAALLGV